MTLFYAANQAMNTTAAPAGVTTGTAIKTMLQIQPPSTRGIAVVAFGVEFFSVLTAAVAVELVDTVSIAATVTAHVAAGVQPYGPASDNTAVSAVTLGTTATGYTASSEGTVTATRLGKFKELPAGAAEYEWEYSFGREFWVPASHNLRIRMTTGTAVNALAWCLWDE
jgi:hypothetical protein